MRRGRIFIYLALILIIGLGAAFLYILQQGGGGLALFQPTPTPAIRYVQVVSAGQNIPIGATITADILSSYEIPEDKLVEVLFTDPTAVIGKLAKYPISQGVPITSDMVVDRPEDLAQTGSETSTIIPPGMTAMSIPITRLSSVAYAIRDGDRINLIASMLFVDVDQNFQSALPNNTAELKPVGLPPDDPRVSTLVSPAGPQGRGEIDPTIERLFYVLPGEPQRPRLVSQMVLQDILVLHVGNFLLPEQEEQQRAAAAVGPTPTPEPGQPATITQITTPDIITLVVTPQDAVTLTYLVYGGARLTLTLRNPTDETRIETEAATLQYLLSQYAIPVPAKLPYALQPRIDVITQPFMPNDVLIVPAQ